MAWVGGALLLCCGVDEPFADVSLPAGASGGRGGSVPAGGASGFGGSAGASGGTTADAGGAAGNAGGDAGPEAEPPGPPLRVLFVGNSYTAFNDMPGVVKQLGAVTPGAAVEVESILKGGARLRDHWLSSDAQDRIATGNYDAVVLQGQSREPFSFPQEFAAHAELFAGALAKATIAGVWFATWRRRDFPIIYTELLEMPYRTAAAINGDEVARVGAAWDAARERFPEVMLYTGDGSHPTAAGSLLAACVMLRTLTGKDPVLPEPPPLGLDMTTASGLCAIASDIPCNDGFDRCGGECIDVRTDVLNCGACAAQCAPQEPCIAGECGCSGGFTACALQCVDLQTNRDNCGECGKECGGSSKVCREGDCVCPDSAQQDITFVNLQGFATDCVPSLEEASVPCNLAAHRLCESVDCFNTGFGPPTPTSHAAAGSGVMCVVGDTHITTYAALQTLVPGCDGTAQRIGQDCSIAIHRFCELQGAVSGFGPIDAEDDEVTVSCVSDATVLSTTMQTLQGHVTRCVPDAVNCSLAAWNHCVDQGFNGGFGPVDLVGSAVDVVCFE